MIDDELDIAPGRVIEGDTAKVLRLFERRRKYVILTQPDCPVCFNFVDGTTHLCDQHLYDSWKRRR